MVKTLQLISRFFLIAGVLVALTPCGLCHKTTMVMAMNAGHSCCAPKTTSGSDHCGSKARDPLCQVMDQSSILTSTVHVQAPVVEAVSIVFLQPMVMTSVSIQSFIPSGSSPPRGPLALRI